MKDGVMWSMTDGAEDSVRKIIRFYYIGHSRPLFLYFRILNQSLILNSQLVEMLIIKFANDWIRTANL